MKQCESIEICITHQFAMKSAVVCEHYVMLNRTKHITQTNPPTCIRRINGTKLKHTHSKRQRTMQNFQNSVFTKICRNDMINGTK